MSQFSHDVDLVTGALGQDGRIIVGQLVARGRTVIGLVRPERIGESSGCSLTGIDLANPAELGALIEKIRPARIFHLAAVHHSSEQPLTVDAERWRAMTAVNHTAVTVMIQAILAHVPTCRLVFAATSQMYRPDAKNDRIIDENTPRDPPTWYGLTKSWAMDAIRFARAHFGLHGSSAILFNHESPYRPKDFVARKITLAAARIRLGLEDRLTLRNIGARADWLSAEDVVSALIRISETNVSSDYVVGSGKAAKVRDLLEAAFGTLDLDWTRYVTADIDEGHPALIASLAKLRSLGWSQKREITGEIAHMARYDLETCR